MPKEELGDPPSARRGNQKLGRRSTKAHQALVPRSPPHGRQGRLTREYTLAGDVSYIDLGPLLFKLLSLLAHASFERLGVIETLLRRVLAHILGDLHGSEVRTTHRAEMGQFGTLSRQGFVVEFLRRLRVQGEVELVSPAKLEARFTQSVIPDAGGRMALGEVSSMRGDLVGNDAVLDVLL